MIRYFLIVLLGVMTVLGEETAPQPVRSDDAFPMSFYKDALPILQRNCQECHRPGQIAPMSFLTYESVRPWAKAIKNAVLTKKMPPWFADPHYGTFRNAPKLTESEIQTLAAWVDAGALEGPWADRPEPREWADGWRIPPAVVVSMSEPFRVAATGEGVIKEFTLENPFKEDTWVTSIEIHPGNPSVVHHVIMRIPDDNRTNAQPTTLHCDGKPVEITSGSFDRNFGYNFGRSPDFERLTGCGLFTTMEAVYAPGSQPLDFRFSGSAKRIRGGSPIHLEVHYTPNGKEATDTTTVGFTLAAKPVQRRFVIMAPEHMADTQKPIPAGDANWETRGEITFQQDAQLVWFMPHMHLRGKDMSFQLIYPDGQQRTALNAQFNFNWQLGYEVEEPIPVPKGTRMVVTAHHDNSANNRMNPDPKQNASWGELTSAEMMLPWFGVLVDGDATPDMIASYRPVIIDGSFGQRGAPSRAKQ